MTPDEALEFLRENHRAVLATTRSDGEVQLSPVVAGVTGDGRVAVSTRETAMKAKNVERRPRAALCAFPDAFFGRWVQVEGPVEVLRLPEAMDHLEALYRQIAGEHPDWDDFRDAMRREQRIVLLLTVERAGPTVSG